MATKNGGNWYYLHNDHLGGTAFVTKRDGTKYKFQAYNAYDSKRLSQESLPTDRQYTGQQKDKTGLYYYNARYYDPALGQFVSPDTIVPDAGRVIDYNRYAYVRGNPIKYNDPSGHCPVCLIAVLAGAAMAITGDVPLSPEEAEKVEFTGKVGGVLLVGGTAAYFAPALLPGAGSAACGNGECADVRPESLPEENKRGPKPWPEGPHNETIGQRINELQEELGPEWEHFGEGNLTEEYVETPGGTKGARRPDITFRNPMTGEYYRENIGRTTADGMPIKRELEALDDLEERTGQRPGFTPYD